MLPTPTPGSLLLDNKLANVKTLVFTNKFLFNVLFDARLYKEFLLSHLVLRRSLYIYILYNKDNHSCEKIYANNAPYFSLYSDGLYICY